MKHDAVQRAISATSTAEIKTLKDTTSELREELEKLKIDKEEQIQIARSEGQNEISQLKATITNLRNRIEETKLRISHSKNTSSNQLEIQSLKNAISEIREELEQAKAEKDDAVQRAVSKSQNEITQLKNSLGILREKLDILIRPERMIVFKDLFPKVIRSLNNLRKLFQI